MLYIDVLNDKTLAGKRQNIIPLFIFVVKWKILFEDENQLNLQLLSS